MLLFAIGGVRRLSVLAGSVFLVAADLREFVAVCFSVHGVSEVLTMLGLVHCWSGSLSRLSGRSTIT